MSRSMGTWSISLSISVSNGIDRFVVDYHSDSRRACLMSLFLFSASVFDQWAGFTYKHSLIFFYDVWICVYFVKLKKQKFVMQPSADRTSKVFSLWVVSVLVWCCGDVITPWQHQANIVAPVRRPCYAKFALNDWRDQTPGGWGAWVNICVWETFHPPPPSIPPSFCPSLPPSRHTPHSLSNLLPFVNGPGLWCREA